MTDTDFQTAVLSEFKNIHSELKNINTRLDTLDGKVDSLEGKVDNIATELHAFKTNQEDFNQASWTLHMQSFEAINTIQQEVVSPWKLRNQHK